MASLSPHLRRGAPLVAVAVSLVACSQTRAVELTPDARGADVRVTFATPRDVRIERAGGDSMLLSGVQRLEGRLASRAGDTLLLRPLTRARTTAGTIGDPGVGRVAAAHVVLGEGVAATGSRVAFSRQRTTTLVLGTLLVLGILVGLFAASGGPEIGFPDSFVGQ